MSGTEAVFAVVIGLCLLFLGMLILAAGAASQAIGCFFLGSIVLIAGIVNGSRSDQDSQRTDDSGNAGLSELDSDPVRQRWENKVRTTLSALANEATELKALRAQASRKSC